ncbi:MAG: hypothetical protein PHH82_00175 [Candidatus ainarchaeum sp.]|nr:hypothetical protein [Candidatus ainarchaeum sp.]
MNVKRISLVCLFLVLCAGVLYSLDVNAKPINFEQPQEYYNTQTYDPYGDISISDLISGYDFNAPEINETIYDYNIYANIKIKSINAPAGSTIKCIGNNSCVVGNMIFTDAFGYGYKAVFTPSKLTNNKTFAVIFTTKYPLAYKGLSMGLKAANAYVLFNILPPPSFSTIATSIPSVDYDALIGAGIYSDNAYDFILEQYDNKMGGINPDDFELPQEVPEGFGGPIPK